MTGRPDLTRWNRAGLSRFEYVDGNAPVFLELLRTALATRFRSGGEQVWDLIHTAPLEEDERDRLDRLEAQYVAERRDIGWEIVRVFARACHLLSSHMDAYANEGFLGTATQWDNVRRLVEMLDYHPAPPASAATPLVLVPKDGAQGTVVKGFQVKHAPKTGSPVVFETLEDMSVDAALRALRPAGYNRNPNPLTGSTLTFDAAIKHLKAGEPLVLEDEQTGTLRACLIQGVLEQAGRTLVTVTGGVGSGFTTGRTIVHAQPVDRLTPFGVVVSEAPLGATVRLREATSGLTRDDVVYISDGALACYRRITDVQGLVVSLEETVHKGKPAGKFTLSATTLARAEAVAASALRRERDGFNIRVAGDRSDLEGRIIAALCDPSLRRSAVGEYEVEKATFIKPEIKDRQEEIDPDAGHTLLKVNVPKGCALAGQPAVWVPPPGAGWAVDLYLQRMSGRLPRILVTEPPKKTAAGDIAVIVSGSRTAWARMGTVQADEDAGNAKLEAVSFWSERDATATFYLADTLVYGHFKQSLRVNGWEDNPTPLSGNSVRLESVPATLRKGMRLLAECAGTTPLVTSVTRLDGAVITLADPLRQGSTAGGLVLRGNVVTAGHGEAKGEKVLGSGSAALSNQSFGFEVAEVSFVADATQTTGVRADIVVRVGGREWKQVATLNDSDPADAHYVIRMTEDGFITVQFGDGVNGQRLPTGANNVRLAYRKGTGLRGNLPPGSLTKPVKPHALIESTLQPVAATGGNDMEGTASLRENAPASVLTIERAVSLSDFGHLAASHSSVWQARAFARPGGLGRRERIEVIVVPANGGLLGDLASTLEAFLLAHAMPGVAVEVTDYTEVSFDMEVEITVDEEAFVADDVRAAVQQALTEAFTLSRRQLGQDVYLSEVYAVVENTTGVVHSTIALNGDRRIRRLPTNERSVRVLGALTLRVAGQAGTGAGDGSADGTTSGTPLPSDGEPPIATRTVIMVDGVGPLYAERLAAAGIDSIRALAALDPDRLSIQMPRPKLWEAVAKAQILMKSAIAPDLAAAVLDRPLGDVSAASLADLMDLTGESAERATQLRDSIRRLQVALDDPGFSTLTLREFIGSR